MNRPLQSFCLRAVFLGAVGGMVSPEDLQPPAAVAPVQPVQAVQPISFPDLRLAGGLSGDASANPSADPSDLSAAPGPYDLQPPCRNYADAPSAQPDMSFGDCWNEKKTAWERTKPTATGPSQPQMDTPHSSGPIDGAKPRETPTP